MTELLTESHIHGAHEAIAEGNSTAIEAVELGARIHVRNLEGIEIDSGCFLSEIENILGRF